MASLVARPNAHFWIQFIDQAGARQTLRLGRSNKRAATQHQRAVETLLANQIAGLPMEAELAKFIAALPENLRSRYVRIGLLPPSSQSTPVDALGAFLESYFSARKREVKPNTWTFYGLTRERLLEYFGPDRKLASITPADARAFRNWLESTNKRGKPRKTGPHLGLASNTVRRRTSLCRQIFRQALEDGLITRNPFLGMPTAVRSNRARQQYIPRADFEKLLNCTDSPRWRTLLCLARQAGLRIPSEVAQLRWEHVDWEKRLITVADSPKTAQHQSRAKRLVPISPHLFAALEALRSAAKPGQTKVFAEVQGTSNLRTTLHKLILKAGLQPWPKLWQNLRASAATDFARALPAHVAAAICGHSQQIAQEHYWTVTNSDLLAATNVFTTGPEISPESST